MVSAGAGLRWAQTSTRQKNVSTLLPQAQT